MAALLAEKMAEARRSYVDDAVSLHTAFEARLADERLRADALERRVQARARRTCANVRSGLPRLNERRRRPAPRTAPAARIRARRAWRGLLRRDATAMPRARVSRRAHVD